MLADTTAVGGAIMSRLKGMSSAVPAPAASHSAPRDSAPAPSEQAAQWLVAWGRGQRSCCERRGGGRAAPQPAAPGPPISKAAGSLSVCNTKPRTSVEGGEARTCGDGGQQKAEHAGAAGKACEGDRVGCSRGGARQGCLQPRAGVEPSHCCCHQLPHACCRPPRCQKRGTQLNNTFGASKVAAATSALKGRWHAHHVLFLIQDIT